MQPGGKRFEQFMQMTGYERLEDAKTCMLKILADLHDGTLDKAAAEEAKKEHLKTNRAKGAAVLKRPGAAQKRPAAAEASRGGAEKDGEVKKEEEEEEDDK
eukprot:4495849-Pyramimonas_sp.AAC.1